MQRTTFLWKILLTIVVYLTGCTVAQSSIVQFEIHLTNGLVDPVGIGSRQAILINGSFVGPTLYAKSGDHVHFLVRNYMTEDTTVHFHGIGQKASPWSDGVPGLTQGLLRPGASYLYKWQAQESGAYFYHAHARAQMMDGMYGAILILGHEERPFHLISADGAEQVAMQTAEQEMQPVMISDWTQFTSSEFHAVQAAANIDLACIDAIIVNGVGSQYCLDQDALDSMTHPVVLQMLKDVGEDHLTDKGCIPPLQIFQGDFDLQLDTLPPAAYRTCIGGQSSKGNLTVPVNSTLGWTALTFINPGSLYPLQVSIDSHEPFIFAVDGHYIHPIRANRILVNTGSRISILIKLDQMVARYTIRIANDYLNQILGGFAELVYDSSDNRPLHAQPKIDFAGQPVGEDVRSFISENSHPFPSISPDRNPNSTFKVVLKKLGRPYGAYEWTLTGKAGYNISREQTNPPLLFQTPSEVPGNELIIKTKIGEWVDVIMVTEGPFAQAHPMHKHGNRIFLLGSGMGNFPWASVEEAMPFLPDGTFNFQDPPYLDTFNTVEIEGEAHDTWTVIRYRVENPGVWLFHCHVQTHLSGGMGMVIMDGVDSYPEVPPEYREWNGFEQPSFASID
ncbi:Multicopper oxidase ctb12 [Vermiconidia calcicola]|uniref:Multicopper oxidase ctb12 n=1 Tax=Vermiconidia calcicola TaxID=1690605 RepID=A0ACC3NBE5_9PEZI|nr:Multicopper oxidase ctb12 [Vermiconidia calcicola]